MSNPLCETVPNHKTKSKLINQLLTQLCYDMSAFQLYQTSWFSQNLSRRALNVFMVGEAITPPTCSPSAVGLHVASLTTYRPNCRALPMRSRSVYVKKNHRPHRPPVPPLGPTGGRLVCSCSCVYTTGPT